MTTGYYIDLGYVVVKKEETSVLSNYKLFLNDIEQSIQPRLYYMDDIQFVSFAYTLDTNITDVKIKTLGLWKEPVLTNAYNGTSYTLDSVSDVDYSLEEVKQLVENTEEVRFVIYLNNRYYLRTDGDNTFVDNGYLTYEYNLPILIDVEKLVDNTKVLTFSNNSILFYTGVVATATVAHTENFERDLFEDNIITTLNDAANDYSIMVLTKNAVNYTATFYDHSSIDYNNTTVYNHPPFLIEVAEKTTTYLTFTHFKKSDIHCILDAELYNNLNTYNNLAGNILNAHTTVINGNIKFDSTDNKYSFNFPHPTEVSTSDRYNENGEYTFDMQYQHNLVHRTRISILNFNNRGGNWSHSVSLWAKFKTFTMLVKNDPDDYQGDLIQCLFWIGKRIPFYSTEHANRHSGVEISYSSSTNKQKIVWGFYQNDIDVEVEIDTDKWYHFCFTYDGAVRKIYLNSFLIKEQQASSDLNILDNTWLSLGSMLYRNNYSSIFENNTHFNGEIRRFVVFNKALTDNEVQILFNDNNFIYTIPFKHPEPSSAPTNTPILLIDGEYSFRNDFNTQVYDLSQNLRIGVGKTLERDVALNAINFKADSFINFDGISEKNGNWSHTISVKVKFKRIDTHLLFYLGNDLHRDGIHSDNHVFPFDDGTREYTTKEQYVDTQAIYAYAYATDTGTEKIGWQLGKQKIGIGTRCEFLQSENTTSNWYNNYMYNRYVWITFVYDANNVTLYIDGNLIGTKNVILQLNLPPIWGITMGQKLIWETDNTYYRLNDVDLKRFEMYDSALAGELIGTLFSTTSSGYAYTNYIDIDNFKKHYNYFPVLVYDANKQLELSQENEFLQTTNIIDFSINNFNPSVIGSIELNNGAYIFNGNDTTIELVIDRTHHFPLLSSTPNIEYESNWSHSIAMIITITALPSASTSIMDVRIGRENGTDSYSFIQIYHSKIVWNGGSTSTVFTFNTNTPPNNYDNIAVDTIQYIFLTYDASTSTRRVYLGDGQNEPTEILLDNNSSTGSISFDTADEETEPKGYNKLKIGPMRNDGKLYKFMIYDYVLDTDNDINAIYNMYKAELDPITQKSTPIFENDQNATTYVNDINFLYTWNLDERLIVSNPTGKTNSGKAVYDKEGIDDYTAPLLPAYFEVKVTKLNRYYDFISKKPIIYWFDAYDTSIHYIEDVEVYYKKTTEDTYTLNTDIATETHIAIKTLFTHKCILSSSFDTNLDIKIKIKIPVLLDNLQDFSNYIASNKYEAFDLRAFTGAEKSAINALNITEARFEFYRPHICRIKLTMNNLAIRPDITYLVKNNNGDRVISEKSLMASISPNATILYDDTITSGIFEKFVIVEVGINDYLKNFLLILESDWRKLNMYYTNERIRIVDLSSNYETNNVIVLNWKSNVFFANYVIQSNGETIVDDIKISSISIDEDNIELYNYTYTISVENLRTPIKVIATFPYAVNSVSAEATLGFLNIEERLNDFGTNIKNMKHKEIYNVDTNNNTLYIEFESTIEISTQTVSVCVNNVEINENIENIEDHLTNPFSTAQLEQNTYTYPYTESRVMYIVDPVMYSTVHPESDIGLKEIQGDLGKTWIFQIKQFKNGQFTNIITTGDNDYKKDRSLKLLDGYVGFNLWGAANDINSQNFRFTDTNTWWWFAVTFEPTEYPTYKFKFYATKNDEFNENDDKKWEENKRIESFDDTSVRFGLAHSLGYSNFDGEIRYFDYHRKALDLTEINDILNTIYKNKIQMTYTTQIESYPPINDLLIVDPIQNLYFKLTDDPIYNSNNTIKITPLDIISDTTKYRLTITNDDSQDDTYSKYIYRSKDLSEILQEFNVINAKFAFQFETEYLFMDEAVRLIGHTDSTTSNLIVREYNDVVLESTFTSDIESKYFIISNIDIQVNLQDEGYLIDIKFDSWIGGQYTLFIDNDEIASRNTILPNSPPEIGTIFELSTEATPSTVLNTLNTFEVEQIPNYNGEYILLKQHGTTNYMRHQDSYCHFHSYEGNNLGDFWWKFEGPYINSPHWEGSAYLVLDNNQLKIQNVRQNNTTPTRFIFNILYGKHVISYGEQEGESVIDFQEVGIENRQLSISKVILDKRSDDFDNIEKEQLSFIDFEISTQKSQVKINFIFVEGINIVLDIDDNNTDKKKIVAYNLYKNNSFNRVKRFELTSITSNKLRISKFDLSLKLNDSLDLREENILGFEKYKGELFFIKLNPIYNLRIERGKNDSDGNYNNNIYSFIFDDDKIEDDSAVNLYLYNLYKDDELIQENKIAQVIEVMEYNDVNMYGIWRIEKRSNIDLVLENAGTIEIKKPNAPKNIFVFKEINGTLTHRLIFDSDEFFSNSTFKVFIRFSSSDDVEESYLNEHSHSFRGQHGTTIKIQEISYLGHESDITDTLTLTRPTPFSSLTTTFDNVESDFILSWF
jgi:hypothetical protein